ncbi:tetratricopeptide repeat protein [Rhodocytophaga rosea]|uniref:Tetratricopeptide repeat protein n=1 Tax=Rhodocytophaga rosea TaxID=2704465 RepID=A0A6C0GC73_9BACT|nr:tetratricopeptide repeat protein [Rhodocytophaga rosea]QHT65423.1 tetratricopeptide repeat protein [Rhodocytophaga rosea]
MRTLLLLRISILLLILPCLILLISVCKPPVLQSVKKTLPVMNVQYINPSHELNSLFARLQRAKDEVEVKAIQSQIWQIWMSSGTADIDALMEKGNQSMTQGNYEEAIHIFSKITRKLPEFAEGWNKRATAYYLKGEYSASLQDIERTLSLENRHFGAISGLASVYLAMGEYRAALKALEKVLEICPNQPGLQEQVRELYLRLGMSKA